MKKICCIIIIAFLAVAVVGCGTTKSTSSNTNNSTQSTTTSSSTSISSGKIDSITKFTDAFTAEQKKTEQIINDYDAMPIMELVTPQLDLASAVFYDILNLDNKDGHFEGKIGLSDHTGFEEKKGSVTNFGSDYVVAENQSFGNTKKGDHFVENGTFDTTKQYFKSEKYTEREGKKISATISEFKCLADGTFLVLQSNGNAFDGKGEEVNSNKYIFLAIGKDRYDFVIAEDVKGPSFTPVLLSDKGELTKQSAIETFKASGWTIEKTGGIVNGKLVKDN